MNTLSYLSLMEQSLVRYDMANDMLKWAQSMSKTSLAKRNFRQLKKFLQNKGYEYERPYPYKGKERCTVSLLDIVRQIESDNFLKPHWGIMDQDVAHMYLTPIEPLNGQKVGMVGREVPEVDARMEIPGLQNLIDKRYSADLPVTEVKSWMPPSQESVDEVNRILKDVIEGKKEGNPLDLYGITTRTQPYSIMKEQNND
ncbi:hypothetical protein YUBABA_01920 [Serratia phage vB_SmaM-Yubaba]|nr:hypothetical protein YUBABA_01920 [Serratia phage vB_SmaM-Yubaba]